MNQPFHVTFGRSPVLTVDIIIGAAVKQKEATVTVPQFVRNFIALSRLFTLEFVKTLRQCNTTTKPGMINMQLTHISVSVIKYGFMFLLLKLAQLRNWLVCGMVHTLSLISLVC